jgi:hypothetical protein
MQKVLSGLLFVKLSSLSYQLVLEASEWKDYHLGAPGFWKINLLRTECVQEVIYKENQQQ